MNNPSTDCTVSRVVVVYENSFWIPYLYEFHYTAMDDLQKEQGEPSAYHRKHGTLGLRSSC